MNLNSVNSQKRTLFNFFSLSVLQIGNYVLPMITLPIISRIIGPEKYGVVNYAYAFVGYFVLFINAGFDFYGARKILEYKDDREKINRLFSSITITKSLLLIISSLLFAMGIFLIPELREEKLVSTFTFLLCIGWVFNPSWLYNGMQDARKYAAFSFISKLLFSIAIIIIIRQRSDYIYQPLIMGLAHVLISFISLFYAIRKYDIQFKFVPLLRIRQTLKENKHLSIIWWFTNQSSSTNILISGFLLSTLDLGIYSAALRMVIIIQTIISMPMNTVLFPYIGEAFVTGYKNGIIRANKAFPYLFLIAASITVGTFIFAKPVILLFYGYQFAEAVILLKIASIVLFFSTINSAFGQQILLHLKLDSTYVKFIVAGFCINVLFLLFFIKTNGSIGAALAWPLSEIFVFISYLIYFKGKKIRILDPVYFRIGFLYENMIDILKLSPLKK
jgi:O-antigen/teichoic acid export membrane protein